MPAGRPPMEFTEEIADRILHGIAEGNSLVSILKEDDELPSYTTVMKWLRLYPEFAANYTRAREDQADHDADKIGDIAEQVVQGKVDPHAARVAIDAYKWAAGKRKPKVYGEKMMVGGSADMEPIRTTTQLDVSNLSLEELEALGAALQKSLGKD
jgi:hypothetical protein